MYFDKRVDADGKGKGVGYKKIREARQAALKKKGQPQGLPLHPS
ncbi:MAG: hypothetical protein Q7T53_06150 [Deltaproteobacteria bacterium]|nr:hypothetical protein [Deltaproteobacteria bacterium]